MNDSTTHRADRYGGPLVPARTAKVIGAIAIAVFLAVVGYVGLQFADQPVKAQVLTYEHIDADTIAVTFQVTMRPGTTASCTVQAMNEGRAQVGFVEIDIPAQADSQTAHHVEIDTQGTAVSAEVLGCERL